MLTSANFDSLFQPEAIAVVGASATSVSGGNRFLRHLKNFGFKGPIYPIHPTASEVEGLKAYSSFEALPQSVDYMYVAVNATQVSNVIRAAQGKAKFAQVMSSGFSETESGKLLETDLTEAARQTGIRIIGPNCLGTYSPEGKITFTSGTSNEIGHVGVLSQSGGLGVDILRRGKNRGVRFGGLVTVGNCADVRPAELLEHFFQSDKFRVIGLYLETAMGGRQLFEVLRKYKNTKPVVLLKGGSTSAGQIAAISHTGALAGSQAAWKALEAQTNLITASTLNEFLDILLALQCLGANGVSHENLILFGNGGGTSVLGADAFARQGFRLANLSSQSLNQLSALNLPAGSSIANPIDVPAGALQQDEGRIAGKILKALVQTSHALTIVHINMTVVTSFEHVDMLGNIIESFMNLQATQLRDGKIALVLRSDGDPAMEQTKLKYRQMAIEAGTPVFDELADAAIALGAIRRSRFNRAS